MFFLQYPLIILHPQLAQISLEQSQRFFLKYHRIRNYYQCSITHLHVGLSENGARPQMTTLMEQLVAVSQHHTNPI